MTMRYRRCSECANAHGHYSTCPTQYALPDPRFDEADEDPRTNPFGRRRFTMPRDFYLPTHLQDQPPNVDSHGTDAAIWAWNDERGRPHAIAFVGKQSKPLWRFYFRNDAERDRQIQETIESRRGHATRRTAEIERRRSFRHGVEVGDIFQTSWGYDQTNVDWYQVVDVRGKSAILRKIAAQVARAERGADYVVPTPDRFVGPPFRTLVQPGNVVRVGDHHGHLWDGEPAYQTAAGWGH